jgi:predicted metal-dependent hydrolase
LSHSITLDERTIPITLRWNASAKRIILRLDPKGKGCIVTLPKGMPEKDGLAMVQRHKVWLANQFNRDCETVPFIPGATIPFRDIPHTLKHFPDARTPVWSEDGEIFVSGHVDFFNRRLSDWLKKQAREDITPLAHSMAEQLGKKVNRISMRDTVSRWGSCSSTGNLSFNWRLIFAPHDILKYVVAHEVAHLRHMNHSTEFWATVDLFDVDPKRARHWLKRNGALIQKIGQD